MAALQRPSSVAPLDLQVFCKWQWSYQMQNQDLIIPIKKKYEMSNFFSCLFTGLNPHATYKSFQQNTLPASHKKSSLPFPPDMQTDSTLSGFWPLRLPRKQFQLKATALKQKLPSDSQDLRKKEKRKERFDFVLWLSPQGCLVRTYI